MPAALGPGPCPPEGCPPPVEVVCVEATKVFDFCFSTLTQDMVRIPVEPCCAAPPAGTAAEVFVEAVDCTVEGVTPVAGSGGFANVLLLIEVTLDIALVRPDGSTLCSFSGGFSFLRTFTLCVPEGASVRCEAPTGSAGSAAVVGQEVRATVSLCLLLESVATVKLLVPSYGYCVPAPCVALPSPPFVCPPSPLFPPACAPRVC